MGDYHTIGAQRDRAQMMAVLTRIATALERIADTLTLFEEDQDESESEHWVSPVEAAELAGKSAPTIRRWAQSGRVNARKSGKTWLIDSASIPPISRVEDLRISDLTDEEADKFWEAINEEDA